ncbi:uncharacterized protein LOC122258365 [Penaeus japonicus]|uniref:uncharacterized protein LOC122258365 n=1 Tax=Penaeus japonicus TaxID=27405 RepID=UPI001C70D5D6|nr:uncharacterized protein LOC122258365 [Penaeus japonicus]
MQISVEGSEDPRCITQGDANSGKTSYLLEIEHDVCGSEVQNTSVLTFIIVQENLPILTHSTRRFLVKCNYVPETFTVRAGVNLPEESNSVDEDPLTPVDQSVYEVDPSELFDSSNNLFDSRLSEEVGRALKMSASEQNKEPRMWAHLVLMVILVMAAVVGLSCAMWHFVRHARTQNRQGFMSPQEEPRILEEGMEAVVRDYTQGDAGPACVENPVALFQTSFMTGTDFLTGDVYDLSQASVHDLPNDLCPDSFPDDLCGEEAGDDQTPIETINPLTQLPILDCLPQAGLDIPIAFDPFHDNFTLTCAAPPPPPLDPLILHPQSLVHFPQEDGLVLGQVLPPPMSLQTLPHLEDHMPVFLEAPIMPPQFLEEHIIPPDFAFEDEVFPFPDEEDDVSACDEDDDDDTVSEGGDDSDSDEEEAEGARTDGQSGVGGGGEEEEDVPLELSRRRPSLDHNWRLGDGEGQIFPAFSQ